MKIPVLIAQTRCQIETEVVPATTALLLSKTSLKEQVQFWTLRQALLKQPVKLELTLLCELDGESTPDGSDIQNEDDILIVTESMKKQEKQKILLKLHS